MDRDRTLTSRYECKYLIPRARVPALRRFLDPFMGPDRFAARHADHRYPICSLYLDGPDLALYRSTVRGLKNRFKLRVRTYSDDPRSPVFFEIKKRIDAVVRKSRAPLDRRRARRLLSPRPSGLRRAPQVLAPAIEEFCHQCRCVVARPVLKIRYTREAYESKGGDPVRITFDRELMYAVPRRFDLAHDAGDWRRTPLEGVILEIKFTDHCPGWVGEMIRVFQLQKRSVAKYVLSVDACRALDSGGGRRLVGG